METSEDGVIWTASEVMLQAADQRPKHLRLRLSDGTGQAAVSNAITLPAASGVHQVELLESEDLLKWTPATVGQIDSNTDSSFYQLSSNEVSVPWHLITGRPEISTFAETFLGSDLGAEVLDTLYGGSQPTTLEGYGIADAVSTWQSATIISSFMYMDVGSATGPQGVGIAASVDGVNFTSLDDGLVWEPQPGESNPRDPSMIYRDG